MLKLGYGFSDHRWKFRLDWRQAFDARERSFVRLAAYRELAFREPEAIYSRGVVTYFCLTRKEDYYDYFLRRGASVGVGLRLSPQSVLSLDYLVERHFSTPARTGFSLFRRDAETRVNPPVWEGQVRALRVALQVDTRKFVEVGLLKSLVPGRPSWKILALAEVADPGSLGGELSYTRLYLSIWRRQPTFASGYLDLWLSLGGGSKQLPPQKRFDLPARYGSFTAGGAFRTVGIREFSGARLAALQVEHNFGSFPFRCLGLPWMKDLKIDWILHAGAGWTAYSGGSSAERATDGGLYEIGFALGRVFTFFRFDFCWRVKPRFDRSFWFALSSSLE